MKKTLLTSSLLLLILSGFSQSLSISVEPGKFQIDESRMLIVSRIDSIEKYANLQQYDALKITFGSAQYSFASMPSSLKFSGSYEVSSGSQYYTLYFTQLPLMAIHSNSSIIDEPKVLAELTYSDDRYSFTSYAGIEQRGGYSQSFPKKTYDIEVWEDSAGTVSRNVSFGSLRIDDDWVMDALYNEPLRIRSYIAHKLWLKTHKPQYLDVEPFAKSGADVLYVELFLNNKYNGVYIISEQVDKKLLDLETFDGTARGQLYKSVSWGGACTFTELPAFSNTSRNWGGYDYKYPFDSELTDWSELYGFTDFVMNSDNGSFESQIWDKFNMQNCLDYYIYLNLIKAGDNRGKNIYLAKRDQMEPYFYTPWDLDACLGTDWRGNNNENTTKILTNGLFARAINLNAENFTTKMGNTWHRYREDFLSSDTLMKSISDAYNYLKNNNVYERESMVYPNYDFSSSSYNYMISWLNQRLSFLDTYFVKTTGINVTKSRNLSSLLLYPDPADTYIIVAGEDNTTIHHYDIFSLTGNLVSSGRTVCRHPINISHLPAGMYVFKMNHQTGKFIVQ